MTYRLEQFLLFLILISYSEFSYSQVYEVSSFVKINESNGNFNEILNAEDWFGSSVEGIGDLDGDGVLDVAVGSMQDDENGFNKGAIYILFLNPDGSVKRSQKIAHGIGGFKGVLDNWDIFGTSISLLGDMNGDGKVEIAVGAEYDGDGGYRLGAVWILSLNTDGTVFSHQKISSLEGSFNGNLGVWDVFGSDVEHLGDLNEDGIQDIAVGARRDDDGGTEKGAVWILFLNTDFTVKSYQKISSTTGNFSGSLNSGDYFGSSIANLGDLNGDGIIDIAVGAYRDNDGGSNSGAIYILFLNTDGTVKSHQKISQTQGGFTDTLYNNSRFGKSIDLIFDINQDGKKEILVGSSGYGNSSNSNDGSFYILNLNDNGTVDSFQKYGANLNGFTGSLNTNDHFGFSVAYVGTNDCNFSIISGAFGDSETGYQKGAVWILNLGEISFNLKSFTNPTSCGSRDGSITISGLTNKVEYTVSYSDGAPQSVVQISNASGELLLTGFGSGNYSDIVVTENSTGCSDNLGQIVLISPDLAASISFANPTKCGLQDGIITISGLTTNVEYTVTYNDGSPQSVVQISNASGELILTGFGSGNYSDIIVTETATGCSNTLGQMVLTSPDLAASISFANPTKCGLQDGVITISGLRNNVEYTVTYNDGSLQSVVQISNALGELILTGFGSGNYSDIIVTETATGCSNTLGQMVLTSPDLEANISFANPSGCGVQDGSITFLGLSANTLYRITYDKGSQQTVTLTSSSNGEIILGNLSAGIYSNILVVDTLNGCSDSLATVTLESTVFDPSITYESPTTCNSTDGSLIISELSGGFSYNISYNLEATTITNSYSADADGQIIVSGLVHGYYTGIIVEESLTGCSKSFAPVDLLTPIFTATIAFLDEGVCGANLGMIVISDLTVGTTYSLTYNFESVEYSNNYIADLDGIIRVTGLSAGIYNDIIISTDSRACQKTFLLSAELGCIQDETNCFKTKLFFTPNNDGYNDYWFLEVGSNQCDYTVFIYNRFGKLLKILTPEDTKWDGNYKGYKMPSTDYWYLVNYNNGERDFQYKSNFSLKR